MVTGVETATATPGTRVVVPSAIVVVFLSASAMNQIVTSRIVVSTGLAPEVPAGLLTAVVAAGTLLHLLAWYCVVLAIQWGARLSSVWTVDGLRLAVRTTGLAHLPLAIWALCSSVGLHYSLGNEPLAEAADVMPRAIRYVGLAKSGAYVVSVGVLAHQIAGASKESWRRVTLTLSPLACLVVVLWLVTRLLG